MRSARFARVTVPGPPKRRAWRIGCAPCGRTGDVLDNTASPMGEQEVARKFAQRGWLVGRKRHVCLLCQTPAPPPVVLRPVETGVVLAPPVVTLKSPEPVMNDTAQDRRQAMVADPPRQPTREDNRRIHEAIERHWNVEQDCYGGDVTDAYLATSLDVPRAWVSAVREQFFGPDQNEIRKGGVAQIADLERRAKDLEAKGLELAAAGETLRADVARLKKALGV